MKKRIVVKVMPLVMIFVMSACSVHKTCRNEQAKLLNGTIKFVNESHEVEISTTSKDVEYVKTASGFVFMNNGHSLRLLMKPTTYSFPTYIHTVGDSLFVVTTDEVDLQARRLYVYDSVNDQLDFVMLINSWAASDGIFCVTQSRPTPLLNGMYFATETSGGLTRAESDAIHITYVATNLWIDDEKNIHFYANTEPYIGGMVQDYTSDVNEVIWNTETLSLHLAEK